MLKGLHIENYALIRNLDLEIPKGFSVITGETGAGKSILLGALSLVIGQRADSQVLWDKSKKCVVEVAFDITDLGLQDFFTYHDLDYDSQLIVRREILSNGKSRAFINDTPASLQQLKTLSTALIDIHSQHQSLSLSSSVFQFGLLDAYIENEGLKKEYTLQYAAYKNLERTIQELEQESQKAKQEEDYAQFLFTELESAAIEKGEQERWETEAELIKHAEQIKSVLMEAEQTFSHSEQGVLLALRALHSRLAKVSEYYPSLRDLMPRFESLQIELKDLVEEMRTLEEAVYFDEKKQNDCAERLDLIYHLQAKHRVQSVDELLELRENLSKKLQKIGDFEQALETAYKEKAVLVERLHCLAEQWHQARVKASEELSVKIKQSLSLLNMGMAELRIDVEKQNEFYANGQDQICFLFNANKGGNLREISKVASGGEMSRLMLAIKSAVRQKSFIPVIIFDEIDTGVSGEVAFKVGRMMKEMAEFSQVIAITHLPQIAAKAETHYRVIKKEDETQTYSEIIKLKEQEHIHTLASMLSGETTGSSAMDAAKDLLSN